MDLRLSKFKAPCILKGSEQVSYKEPSAIKDGGMYYLFCTQVTEKGQDIVLTKTSDFRYWSKPTLVFEGSSAASYGMPHVGVYSTNTLLSVQKTDLTSGQTSTIVCSTADFQEFRPVDIEKQAFDAFRGNANLVNARGSYFQVSADVGMITSESSNHLAGLDGSGSVVLDLDQQHFEFAKDGLYNPALLYDEAEDFFFLFYQAGEAVSSIALAVSKDCSNFISFARDKRTYPEHGIIYDGDYYKPIPFSEYIKKEPLPTGENVFDIRSYGAVPDTAFISTPAFQAAIDAAKQNGGGIILVTGGYYCTSTVSIPSNTTLFIDMDSAIYASKDLARYDDMLVGCIDAENVTIRGGGKIIGNGEYFVYLPLRKPALDPMPHTKMPPTFFDNMGYPVDTTRYAYRSRIRYAEDKYGEGLPPTPRPMNNVWIRNSKNVLLENIIIEDAFEWTLDIDFSQNVVVRDVVIDDNRHVANTDGIDIMSSINVTVDHCFISCADDGLCIKAPFKQGHDGLTVDNSLGRMGPTKNVKISNCTVSTVMNAFKIGTGTFFDITDITIEDCKFIMPDIYPGSVSGISIESADGGHVRNVVVRNITMDKVCCPIFICLNMRNCDGYLDEEDKQKRFYGGAIENVLIENITADDVEVPNIITGFEIHEQGKVTERRVKDITIRNYEAVYLDNLEILKIKDQIHENLRDYPECNSFGDVPAYGFFVRHASNVKLEGINVVPRSMNTRMCIVKDKVD